MKKLLLPLLLTSMTIFAVDLTYYDSNRLLNQSAPGQKLSQVVLDKFAPQQTDIDVLSVTIKTQEAQLTKYYKSAASYNDMSDADKSAYTNLVASYRSNLSKLSHMTQVYNQQKDAVTKYVNIQLNILASRAVKSYALSHNLQAIYRANQFGYVESSFDVTDKILPELDALDVTDVISAVKTANVGFKVNNDFESR